jgi:hypothetical protein
MLVNATVSWRPALNLLRWLRTSADFGWAPTGGSASVRQGAVASVEGIAEAAPATPTPTVMPIIPGLTGECLWGSLLGSHGEVSHGL